MAQHAGVTMIMVPMAPDASANMERTLALYYNGSQQAYEIWERSTSHAEVRKVLIMYAPDRHNCDPILDAMIKELESWGSVTDLTTPYNQRFSYRKYHLHRTPMVEDRIIALNARLTTLGQIHSNYGSSILISKSAVQGTPTSFHSPQYIGQTPSYVSFDPSKVSPDLTEPPPQGSWRDRPPLL